MSTRSVVQDNAKRVRHLLKVELRLVPPYFKEGRGLRLMLVGQDPTIKQEPGRVKQAHMLDDPNSLLSRWLREDVLGEKNFGSLTLYAANLVICAFPEPPSAYPQGALEFLRRYFKNCKGYLSEEISRFQPTLVLTLGEPGHKLFITILDNRGHIAQDMNDAFTGGFIRAKFGGVQFDYSPCLHITTWRVPETYGERLERFKRGLEAYFKEAGEDRVS